ncbi:MAG: hypothetical protein QY306_13285 [Anaerolineales bacterium]|nr:MAG: hypothetical protein QY306_13285 [Anaerolineales bacterium]
MPRSKPILMMSIGLALIVLSGCLSSGPNENSINTMVAQIVSEAETQTAAAFTITPIVTSTATLTSTSTQTPTLTLSPTPIFTFTPAIPQISVSVPTNCRVGPGAAYRRVGALLVGESAQVYGRDPTGRYWFIQNPDSPGNFCWLWGEYATVTGNFAVLPVFTPPPTPTFTPTPLPDIRVSYSGKDTCVGWWVEIEIKNRSDVTFRSIALTVKDTVTNITISTSADDFTDLDGCLTVNTNNKMNPGTTHIVSAPAFAYDPTGHKLTATVTACSEKGLNGICVSEQITFTP